MITLAYIAKLGVTTQKSSVKVQKIDSLLLTTYGMTLAKFLFQNSLRKNQFLEKTFYLTNTSNEVVLKMSFFFFSFTNIKFGELIKLT